MNLRALPVAMRVLSRDLRGVKHEPEPELLPELVSGSSVCLHIGASDGRHSFAILKVAPEAKIHAFEPSTFGMAALKHGIRFRGLGGRISTYPVAVSDAPGELSLITPRKKRGNRARSYAFVSAGGASTRADYDGAGHFEERVKVVRLDDMGFERVDFIRMDIEGAEVAALKGAMRILERDRPHALIEVHPIILRERFDTSADELADMMRSLGYRFFMLTGGDLVELADL